MSAFTLESNRLANRYLKLTLEIKKKLVNNSINQRIKGNKLDKKGINSIRILKENYFKKKTFKKSEKKI